MGKSKGTWQAHGSVALAIYVARQQAKREADKRRK